MYAKDVTTEELVKRAQTRRYHRYDAEIVEALRGLDLPEAQAAVNSGLSDRQICSQLYNGVIAHVPAVLTHPSAEILARTWAATVMTASRRDRRGF